ncbi:MAG TPA: RsmD family RNA methyltransferase [Solirubrobacterales bacterium]|nr:RsmD family RNA methyltransferase [Solirubrobacterales bacterium]
MRVIAGELRGRTIHSPRGQTVRPTADRVREAVFSILREVAGARVLDLYCGTGALGIEAISRGAASAELVDTRTSTALRNVRELGLEDRCAVIRSDAMRYLRHAESQFDLVFCDPPYKLADRLATELESLIAPRLAEGGRLIVESAVRQPLEIGLPLVVERRYGDTLIRVHRESAR